MFAITAKSESVGSTTCESAKVNLFAFYRALLGNRIQGGIRFSLTWQDFGGILSQIIIQPKSRERDFPAGGN